MAELASSRLIQVESEGQQKSSGSFVLLQLTYDVGHESEDLGRRPSVSNVCPEPWLRVAKNARSNSTDGRPQKSEIDMVMFFSSKVGVGTDRCHDQRKVYEENEGQK